MNGRANVGEFDNAETEVLTPITIEEVRSLIQTVPIDTKIHTFSTGYNWGLGSSVPVDSRPTSVSVSGMRTVRDIDIELGWAVIEAGVTQAELSQRLAGTTRMLNVTASSAQTSVLGNALDRGVGLRRHRTEDLLGVEITLADSSTHRIGWWPDSDQSGRVPYRYGTGPDLLGLFTQSNFGVVTAGVVSLLRRPEATAVVKSAVPSEHTPQLLDALANALASGLINAVPKIYSPGAQSSYAGADRSDESVVYFAVDGSRTSVDTLTHLAIEQLGLHPTGTEIFHGTEDLDAASDPVTKLVVHGYTGDVSAHDHLVVGTLGAEPANVDASGTGWIFFLPLLFSGERALLEKAYSIIGQHNTDHGPTVGATANLLGPDIVDFVVSIAFDRSSQTTSAHRILTSLHADFRSLGVLPYRLDAGHPLTRNANDLVRVIRDALDPHRRFSGGRYLPDEWTSA
ncbi:FAD-binding protein [Rhodococcus sp. G-MC3]|uniref:FAD-binding oxidoreductase n=1 Tax=Rhodococcus sp. G-MC3 TaxID=3046209 RepID=UPI0024B95FAC|nr:FAD-binding protein [Rhodococcus sp. G-MC3]MDJ0395833.1 FAD-binding protein [Rhodococcus sp. G-MC3]